MHKLSDFLPPGTCEPPKPMIYRALAELCEEGGGIGTATQDVTIRDSFSALVNGPPSSMCPPPHDPDPYEWDVTYAHHQISQRAASGCSCVPSPG